MLIRRTRNESELCAKPPSSDERFPDRRSKNKKRLPVNAPNLEYDRSDSDSSREQSKRGDF